MMEVVCAMIINEKSQIFAARRAAGKSFEGYWEFPGGKIESNEKPASALARELREELGVNLVIGQSVHAVEWENKTGRFRLEAFAVYSELSDLKLQDHDEWAWFEVDDLLELEMMIADLALLPYLERYLQSLKSD